MFKPNQWVGTVFSAEEVESANMEMAQSKCRITSIGKNGLFIGTTKPGEEDGFISVYDENGFFVASLNFAWGNQCDGRVESVELNRFYLKLVGTQYEEDAKKLSYEYALFDHHMTAGSQDELDQQEEILVMEFYKLKEASRHLWENND